ncbi:MAG TPA: hypothetical protein VHD63_16765 [Ktedonobacteraceae bacterium]|nr:hypothetical protein [Ktedonobacteraceae bacterium]
MTQQMLTTPSSLVTSTPTHPQETRRQQTIARALGAETFTTIPWSKLMQEGAIIHLHIGRCRFSTRLLLEDMGIHIEDDATREKVARWLILGEKRLLPEAYMKALARIEGSARYALKEHAFQTELGSFVPVTSYVAWRAKTEALREEYLTLRDEIIAKHRELTRQVLAEYETIAVDTYQRLRQTHPELVHESQQQFVASYCNRIADQIPTVERIRESFSFTFFRVESLQQLGMVPAERSTPTLVPTQGANASGAEEEMEATLATSRNALEQRARARAILEQDLRHDAQARVSAALDTFLSSIVAQLRTLTYDAASDVLSTLQRRGGESFSGQSTRQLNHLLTHIRSLNFFGDADMEQMMARIQEIVDMTPQERQRSLGEIGQTLRAIATTTRATLLDLEEEVRAPRTDLGIVAYPTSQQVSAARAELHLPPLDLGSLSSLPADMRVGAGRAEFTQTDAGSIWHFARQHESAAAARTARTL